MTGSDLHRIYEAIIELYKQDKSVTNIIVDFQIKPIRYEKKTSVLNITTFDGIKDYKLKTNDNFKKPIFDQKLKKLYT
jgi:hypothetical protein